MKRVLVLALVPLALVACAKKTDNQNTSVRAAVTEYRDAVCTCKNTACVNTAAAKYTRAVRGREAAMRDPELVALAKQASECVAKIDPARAAYETQPEVPATVTADTLVRATREWIAANYPGTYIRTLRAEYVEANGTIEPDHGELHFGFGAPQTVVDDPKRKTGVPAPRDAKVVTICPGVRWLIQDRWHTWQTKCDDMPAHALRCSVDAIWKRAIAEGAPADAVAKISFDIARDQPWLFQILDEPRKIQITHRFADDCELAVEKP